LPNLCRREKKMLKSMINPDSAGKKLSLVLGFMLIFVLAMSVSLFAQNNCLDFDGDNDYVISNNTINLSGGALTLEAWIYVDAFQTVTPYISQLVGTEDVSNSAFLRLGDADIPAGNKIEFVLHISTEQQQLTSSSILETGIWYHIAGTYDGSNMHIYINGVEDASRAQTGNFTSNEKIVLGRANTHERHLDGKLDEVRIWNDARTETEIRQNMYQELSGSEAYLIAYYKFDETSNRTTDDAK